MRIEHTRENVFTVVATGQELSALIAAGRMALDVMKAGGDRPPRETVEHLERVLDDFDRARGRLHGAPASAEG